MLVRRQTRVNRGFPAGDEAFALYTDATKCEAKGDVPGALAIYEDLVARFPGTEPAKDAQKSIESLRRRNLPA